MRNVIDSGSYSATRLYELVGTEKKCSDNRGQLIHIIIPNT